MTSLRTTSIAVLAAALLALGAVPANAAPPAAVDEYTEMIPGGDGDKPSRDVDRGTSGNGPDSSSPVLPPAVTRALEQQGSDGEAVARIAEATAPRVERKGQPNGGSAAPGVDTDTDTGGDSSISSVVADVIGGSDDGLGPVLPVILGVSLLAAVTFVLLRRRHATGE